MAQRQGLGSLFRLFVLASGPDRHHTSGATYPSVLMEQNDIAQSRRLCRPNAFFEDEVAAIEPY